MTSLNLKCETQRLLTNRARTLTYQQISEICQDVGITPTWLHNFAANRLNGYDVDKVQVLYELLSGKRLLVIAI